MKHVLDKLLRETLSALGHAAPAGVLVERTRDRKHGDFATNVALALAKNAGRKPRELAEEIIKALPASGLVAKTEIAGPGFINFFLSDRRLPDGAHVHPRCRRTLRHERQWPGRKSTGRVRLRQPHGSPACGPRPRRSLGRLPRAAPARRHWLEREPRVLLQRCRRADREPGELSAGPLQGRGTGASRLARGRLSRRLHQGRGPGLSRPGDRCTPTVTTSPAQATSKTSTLIRHFAVAYLRREQDLDLQGLRRGLRRLFPGILPLHRRQGGEDCEGTGRSTATPTRRTAPCGCKTTDFGDDKDRVMRKSDGTYTYFLPDVAYHLTQVAARLRARQWTSTALGPSFHHRTGDASACRRWTCGIPKTWPDYVLHQMVTVMQGGEEVKISKRAGSYVTLRDLIDMVGTRRHPLLPDRAQVRLPASLRRGPGPLQEQRQPGVLHPVRPRPHHERGASACREKGIGFDAANGLAKLAPLQDTHEQALMVELSRYPEMVESAARAWNRISWPSICGKRPPLSTASMTTAPSW